MIDTTIASVLGRRVWDSRGRPTVEVDVQLGCGARGRAIAPAGASMGSGEAVDLRDGGHAFGGLDVRRAVAAVNEEVGPRISGLDADNQEEVDRAMTTLDGTPNRSRLGGNAIVATSMAVLQARAAADKTPLWKFLAQESDIRMPLPEIQIFGGGAHAARRVDIQDFMIMCPGASSFAEALDWTAEVYRHAGLLMKERGSLQGVADEGGYWPAFRSNEEVLESLVVSIERAGFKPGVDIGISLDVAASEFEENSVYTLALGNKQYDTDEWIAILGNWLDNYPILSVEDPLGENDTKGFQTFTRLYGSKCQIIGDDYLVTNAARVVKAAKDKALTAVLIKPNQAGTITETREALEAAKANGLGAIVSARSGESEDVIIAHLATGWNAGQFKVGSFSRSERMAKWNEVLRIEESLGSRAKFAGRDGLVFTPSPDSHPVED